MDLTQFTGQIPRARSVFFFCRTPVPHYGNLLNCRLSSHISLFYWTFEATLPHTKKEKILKNTVYMLVVNAVCMQTGVCSSSWVYTGLVIINVLLFSEVIVVVGREHRGRAYRSVSNVLGWGWEVGDVWLCIHCVIYKGNCTVLYCCVGENVCIFSIKHSGFWEE